MSTFLKDIKWSESVISDPLERTNNHTSKSILHSHDPIESRSSSRLELNVRSVASVQARMGILRDTWKNASWFLNVKPDSVKDQSIFIYIYPYVWFNIFWIFGVYTHQLQYYDELLYSSTWIEVILEKRKNNPRILNDLPGDFCGPAHFFATDGLWSLKTSSRATWTSSKGHQTKNCMQYPPGN